MGYDIHDLFHDTIIKIKKQERPYFEDEENGFDEYESYDLEDFANELCRTDHYNSHRITGMFRYLIERLAKHNEVNFLEVMKDIINEYQDYTHVSIVAKNKHSAEVVVDDERDWDVSIIYDPLEDGYEGI